MIVGNSVIKIRAWDIDYTFILVECLMSSGLQIILGQTKRVLNLFLARNLCWWSRFENWEGECWGQLCSGCFIKSCQPRRLFCNPVINRAKEKLRPKLQRDSNITNVQHWCKIRGGERTQGLKLIPKEAQLNIWSTLKLLHNGLYKFNIFTSIYGRLFAVLEFGQKTWMA